MQYFKNLLYFKYTTLTKPLLGIFLYLISGCLINHEIRKSGCDDNRYTWNTDDLKSHVIPGELYLDTLKTLPQSEYTIKLIYGPEGMTFEDSVVTWQVPVPASN